MSDSHPPRHRSGFDGAGSRPPAYDDEQRSTGEVQVPGSGVPQAPRRDRRPSPLDVLSHHPDGTTARPRQPRMPRSDEFSAGGLVVQSKSAAIYAALIGRTDRRGRLLWSLPKGHIEPGETEVQAAVREVEEETGIVGVIRAPLGKISYWFVADGKRVHKTVTHFLMDAVGGELSDEDAEVVEVAWVALEDLRDRLAYADERRIATDAIRLLADSA